MPRKRKHEIPEEKLEIMRQIIEEYEVETAADLQEALKDLLGGTIQTMLNQELESQLEEREASDEGYPMSMCPCEMTYA